MSDEHDPSPEPEPQGDGLQERAADVVARAAAWGEQRAQQVQGWVDAQRPETGWGVAIGWFTRYRRADGQLYALLLAAYLFVTVLPALLAIATYTTSDPTAVADRLTQRLGIKGDTATLIHDVLQGAGGHQFTATLIAVASVVTFGLGLGRTLQLVYARVWGVPPQRGVADSARYFVWLLVFLAGGALFVIEQSLLRGQPGWISWALSPLWVLAVAGIFAWSPVLLLHGRVTARQALPGALLCAGGLTAMRILSSYKLADWLNWYSKYYGGIGIVMALFFWLVLAMTILVVTAALSPAWAVRAGQPGRAQGGDPPAADAQPPA